jgi:hypothetical protein
VRLSKADLSESQEGEADGEGQFVFARVVPGPFQLIITSPGFTTRKALGVLEAGQNLNVEPIMLAVETNVIEVQVALSRKEVAQAEIKDQEKQRVLGILPNFYVTYDPAAVPLSSRQKFELAWKATQDPINYGIAGAVAGIQMATHDLPEYGQGASGYGKRFGASYANFVTSTFIGSAVLPSVFKQDPRYFYKGSGSKRSRLFYAMANAVICKGDNGRWQANYSGLLGSLASGGISNFYYPAQERDATVTIENTLFGIGSTAVNNLLQEFVIRKLTPHAPRYAPAAGGGGR